MKITENYLKTLIKEMIEETFSSYEQIPDEDKRKRIENIKKEKNIYDSIDKFVEILSPNIADKFKSKQTQTQDPGIVWINMVLPYFEKYKTNFSAPEELKGIIMGTYNATNGDPDKFDDFMWKKIDEKFGPHQIEW